MDLNRMFAGMIRAARLDTTFYEEVEHDPSYDRDALGVVLLVAIIGAFGGFLGSLIRNDGFLAAVLGLIVGLVLFVVWYYVWVYIAHFVGTRFFKATGDVDGLRRAFGFAYAPQVLNVLSFIPCVGGLIGFVAWLWCIATGYTAVRQALNQDSTNAALTVIVSAVIVFILGAVVAAVLATLGIGVAAITGALGSL